MDVKTIKRAAGSLCFVLILVMLIHTLTFITRDKNEADIVSPFYDEEKNSLDVLFVGSSHSMCSIYPLELYHDYGIVSYNFTSSALVMPQAYYQAVEGLRMQSPEVLVFDVSSVVYENTKVGTRSYVHVQLDNMKWSLNKVAAINDLIEKPGDRLEYYFPLVKFHTRWKEPSPSDFQPIVGISKGAYVSDAVLKEAGPVEIVPKDQVVQMSEYAETYLRRVLDYCRGKGVPVLLVNPPETADAAAQGKYNAVYAIAEEYGVPYLNFLHCLDDIGFDYTTDMRDHAHCNRSGAEKVTAYIGNFLTENYDLPDRREDPAYSSAWNEAYEAYKSAYPKSGESKDRF